MSTHVTYVSPSDARYQAVVDRQFNKRYTAVPDAIAIARTTADVVAAVQRAVNEDRRIVATSGGHCLEGFVSDPDVRVIVDVSPMKRVYFDDERKAIAVEAGTTVGETYRALFDEWGVMIPLGQYPAIGTGGHVAGGGFGFFHRQFGLAADHLYGVEVVTVDEHGRAGSVVATREPADPHRDLWWAHTGGGAGTFGIVTRQWFRSPTATGDDPAALLPRAPAEVTTFTVQWPWGTLDQTRFQRLMNNHGAWSERHAVPDSPSASMFTLMELHRRQFGRIVARGVTTASATAPASSSAGRARVASAREQIEEFVSSLADGITMPLAATGQRWSMEDVQRMPWLDFVLQPFPDLFAPPPPGGVRMKAKDAVCPGRVRSHAIRAAPAAVRSRRPLSAPRSLDSVTPLALFDAWWVTDDHAHVARDARMRESERARRQSCFRTRRYQVEGDTGTVPSRYARMASVPVGT
jgi:hypothetical protein